MANPLDGVHLVLTKPLLVGPLTNQPKSINSGNRIHSHLSAVGLPMGGKHLQPSMKIHKTKGKCSRIEEQIEESYKHDLCPTLWFSIFTCRSDGVALIDQEAIWDAAAFCMNSHNPYADEDKSREVIARGCHAGGGGTGQPDWLQ